MFVKRDVIARDAIRSALDARGWMSREDLAAATGFSWQSMKRRTSEMSMMGELIQRNVPLQGGGMMKEFRLVAVGATQEGRVLWEPRELDEALGGVTFPVGTIKHPRPSVRHRAHF